MANGLLEWVCGYDIHTIKYHSHWFQTQKWFWPKMPLNVAMYIHTKNEQFKWFIVTDKGKKKRDRDGSFIVFSEHGTCSDKASDVRRRPLKCRPSPPSPEKDKFYSPSDCEECQIRFAFKEGTTSDNASIATAFHPLNWAQLLHSAKNPPHWSHKDLLTIVLSKGKTCLGRSSHQLVQAEELRERERERVTIN